MKIKTHIIFLFVAVVVLCANSCMIPKVTTNETKTVTYKDTTIAVKGDDVKATLSDSLLKVLLQMKAEGKEPTIVYRNTPNSPTNLTVHLDGKGQLQADCKTDDQLIKSFIKEISDLKETIRTVKEFPQWMMYAFAGIVGLLLILLIFFIIKSKF